MITLIDYGMGNHGSFMNMFRRLGVQAELTADVERIAAAQKLVLPGVGAFDKGMQRLRAMGVIPTLDRKVLQDHTPILGVCLGVQLFGKGSEEGQEQGLGWVDARSLRFHFETERALRIPHMGWNTLTLDKPHPVLCDLPEDARFYFVHSYHVVCNDQTDVLASSHYGIKFTAGVARGSIVGLQFHPEKSLRWGMDVFRKFAAYEPRPATTRDSMPAAA